MLSLILEDPGTFAIPTASKPSLKAFSLIFFERSLRSEKNSIKVYTHLFHANEQGEPGRLKNLRKQSLQCASETWNELIEGGWTVVTNKFQ